MRRRNRFARTAFLASLLISASITSIHAQTPVALELVLAIDTSTSVDDGEFALQTQGLASAFGDPSVVRAIENHAPDGIAVSIVHWSGRGLQKTSVGWTVLQTAADVTAFSKRISAAPRLLRGFTDIAGAIRYAQRHIAGNTYVGRRQVIDVSGDGSSNSGRTKTARDEAVAAGITINGLVIHNEEYDLGELAKINLVDHYRDSVIGGPGAFLMIAKDFADFRTAIRKKLLREITGPLFSGRAGQAPAIE